MSETELEILERSRRSLRQQIIQKRIEYRRRTYALQSSRNISFGSVFCSCLTLGPRFSWLVQDIIEALDTAGETERLQLYEYYVKMTEDYDVQAKRAGWWLYHLQTLRTTFNIILPAVLALQNVSEVSHLIMWLTWGLSLAVSLATGYIDLYRLRDSYEMYTRASEHLKLEGWQFFALTGRYKGFKRHQEALHIFLMRVAKIRKRTIDREFPPQHGGGSGIGGGGAAAAGGGGAGAMEGMFAGMTTSSPQPLAAAPSIYSNSNSNSAEHRSPITMQSQPSTSSSEKPVPPRSRIGRARVAGAITASKAPPRPAATANRVVAAAKDKPLARKPAPAFTLSPGPTLAVPPAPLPPTTTSNLFSPAAGARAFRSRSFTLSLAQNKAFEPTPRRAQQTHTPGSTTPGCSPTPTPTPTPSPPPPPGFVVGAPGLHKEEAKVVADHAPLFTPQQRPTSLLDDTDDDSGTDKDIAM